MKTVEQEFELDDNGKSYIEVSDDMRLVMSPRNWQLQKKLIAKTDTKSQKAGDVIWTSFRYYITLHGALNDIIHIMTSKENFNTVQGLVKANTKVVNQLKQAFSPEYDISLVA